MKAIMSLVQYLGVGTLALGILAGCSKKAEVPAVVGLSLEAATAKLTEKGLVVGKVDAETGAPETTPGTVLRQEPAAGQPLDKGGAVRLVMDNTVVVPDFKGMDFGQVTKMASTLGILLQPETGSAKKGVVPNSIIEQDPPAGRMPSNFPVRIVVASVKKGGLEGFFETVDKTLDSATGTVEKIDAAAEKGRKSYDTTKGIIDKNIDKNKPEPKPDRKPATNAEPRPPVVIKIPVKTSRVWLESFEPVSPAAFVNKRMVRVKFGYETAVKGAVTVMVIPLYKGSRVQTDPHPVAHNFPGTGDKGSIHFSLKQAGPIDEIRLELRSAQNPAVLLCESRKNVSFRPVILHPIGDAKDRPGKDATPTPPKGGVVVR